MNDTSGNPSVRNTFPNPEKESNSAAVRLFKLRRTADAFHKFHLTLTLLTFILEEHESAKKKGDLTSQVGDSSTTFTYFSHILSLLPWQVSEDIVTQAKEMSLTCLSNMAACHFQWANHPQVAKLASRVLEKQPANVKLLYRRGVAHLEMRDFEAARK